MGRSLRATRLAVHSLVSYALQWVTFVCNTVLVGLRVDAHYVIYLVLMVGVESDDTQYFIVVIYGFRNLKAEEILRDLTDSYCN